MQLIFESSTSSRLSPRPSSTRIPFSGLVQLSSTSRRVLTLFSRPFSSLPTPGRFFGSRLYNPCTDNLPLDPLILKPFLSQDTWVSLTPQARLGEPEDLKGAIVYLTSDSAAFTTGHNLIVDGGYSELYFAISGSQRLRGDGWRELLTASLLFLARSRLNHHDCQLYLCKTRIPPSEPVDSVDIIMDNFSPLSFPLDGDASPAHARSRERTLRLASLPKLRRDL